jgi:hypothetical protein
MTDRRYTDTDTALSHLGNAAGRAEPLLHPSFARMGEVGSDRRR